MCPSTIIEDSTKAGIPKGQYLNQSSNSIMSSSNGSSNKSCEGLGLKEDGEKILKCMRDMNQAQALEENCQVYKKEFGASPAHLLKYLSSDLDAGITSASVEERREFLGSNTCPSKAPASFWQLFVDTFDDETVQILMVAAIVSLAVGLYDDPATGYVEGVAILAAVLIVSVVTAVNDYEKERQFRALSKANDDILILVVRDGVEQRISIEDIVVGDIIHIEAGDQIPCDGVLIKCDAFEVDESALTGEPIDIAKNLTDNPFVLSGCTATAGTATFVAMAVGMESQWGMIKAHLEKEQDQTPLQEKLDDMASLIGYVGMAAAGATFIAMMFIKLYVKPDYLADVNAWSHALDAFIIGVTIVVVAVPEGLPLAVTISLAFSTQKMLQDQNLIRHLDACETMGNATNICSDKTGTLTENRMTVVRGTYADSSDVSQLSTVVTDILCQGISTCSTARLLDNSTTVVGNKTEGALLTLAHKHWNNDYAQRREAAAQAGSILFPFSSKRKRMSVYLPASKTLFHKGAAETVLESCTQYLTLDGTKKPLTQEKRTQFEQLIQTYAKDALRCVALSHKSNFTLPSTNCEIQDHENELCLDAIVGIMDPLRPDVKDAVKACQLAGIMVRMVTGDNLDTANAIAREAGILTEGGVSMVGRDFRKLTPAQLDQVLPKLQVLARSSPEDKHILVQRLNGALMPKTQEEWEEFHPRRNYHKEKDLLLPGYYDEWAATRNGVGEVVGVTGDGTNDGPALKAADVGLSMGLSGTDVAKKASDIIIMDDNFSSIVKAVLWGRSVFDNIRKFLQFQLTVNVVALTITFVSAVAGYKPPLNAVMMLWVNLIMDTMGALALGTEPPTLKLLERPPYKRDASLINYPMWRNILVQATYQLGLLIFLLKKGPAIFNCESGSTYHFTIMFNAFVFCQIFNEFNARDIGDTFAPFAKLRTSPMFLFVVIVTVLSQYVIVTYGGDFTQTHPLTASEWKITSGLGFVSIPIGFIMRQIPVDEDPDSFAVNTFTSTGKKSAKKQTNGLTNVIIILVPIIVAGGYQLLQMN